MTPLKYRHKNRNFGDYFGSLLSIVFLVHCFLGAHEAFSDEVILTTGEKFTSSKVWEEDGKIRFNMHGLVVSVKKTDIATVIGKDGIRHQFTPLPQSQSESPTAEPTQIAPLPAPAEKSAAKQTDQQPTPKPKSSATPQPPIKQKHHGIGLNGIQWLMSPSQIPDLEKIKKDPAYGGIDQYWRPNERMQLGPALLDGRVYGFWRNQLYSIMMWAEGRPGYERLQKAVVGYYGPGRKNSKGIERHVWLDATTDRMLQFDTELNTGFFWMRSRKLDTQIKRHYPDG